jgi:tetratricopeptide (TPR) repeat protein
MTAAELADRLVAEPSSASRLLAVQGRVEGLSEAFFGRVLRLFATDHGTLLRLTAAARQVVRYGDDPALAYRSLAVVEMARGRWLASAEGFIKAGDHAANELDRLAFKRGAVRALARGGRVEEAIALGQSLIEGLEARGEDGQAAQVALNLALAQMDRDRYEEAWRLLDGLPERLARAGHLDDAASARLALAISLLFGGDVARARAEAEAAAQEAEALGHELRANIARGDVAYADILRGDPDLAVASLLRLRHALADAPVELAEILEFLGDAFAVMNLWIEAADAYREALALGSAVSPLRQAHLRLGLGQTLLASGQAREALAELAKASGRYRSLGNRAWQAAAETDRAEAERTLGQRGVRSRIEGAIELARDAASPYHLARALLVSAEIGGPDAHLEEAATILRRHPYARLGWRVHAERARRATGTDRLRHHRKAFAAILEEQARLSSFASRLGYLRDKSDALKAYLEDLLAKPTPTRLAEAIEVVSRSRAVALLDELLRAKGTALPEGAAERLRELRADLNDQEGDSPTKGSRRRSGSFGRLDRMQRNWVEETHSLERSAALEQVTPAPDSVVIVESGGRYRALTPSRLVDFPLTGSLESTLEWLSYDLLSPMLERDADARPAMQGLRELGQRVLGPLLELSGAVGICPEGTLWRVPWLACLDALGETRDLELRMHPGLRGRNPDIGAKPAMLWMAEHADLPWVSAEAEMFLGFFPKAQVCRSAEEVRECLSDADVSVLHVISHARHRWRHPMFSSLDFTDGPVLAAEIGRSGLRAELVTLSGCDTGRVSDTNRFEPDGLVRAFLACGAGFVVGSAWPLDDEAAVHLYGSFYNSMSMSPNVHVSLRKARQTVQNWRGHPYFWASPLLYGGYRK